MKNGTNLTVFTDKISQLLYSYRYYIKASISEGPLPDEVAQVSYQNNLSFTFYLIFNLMFYYERV